MATDEPTQICCVGGGKGGVGKSVLSLNMAHALAADGMQVVLADLDLGGANLHTLLGVHRPPNNLRDFFGGGVQSLNEILVPLPALGFSLLPGGDEVAGVVQPGTGRKRKLLRHLRKLPADVVVCDLGGNSNLDTLDLCNLADVALVVTSSEPTSIQNAYGFAKASILRKVWSEAGVGSVSRELIEQMWDPTKDQVGLTIEELIVLAEERDAEAARLIRQIVRSSRLEMVVNMSSCEEARHACRTLTGVIRRFLGLQMNYLGFVESDQRIHQKVMRGEPPLIGKELFNPRLWRELITRFEPATAVGVNEELRISGEVLHVQTEDLGRHVGAYQTLVYSGGRILLSKRVTYDSPFMSRTETDSKKQRVLYLHRTVIQAIRSGRIALSKSDESASAPIGDRATNGVDHASGQPHN